MIHDLTIDKEFESVIPPLDEDEFETLRKNILRDGEIYHPIIVWNNIIVDGHHRYKILTENPTLKYRFEEKQFNNRYEAIVWICQNQLGRRNLSVVQKIALTGSRYKAEKMAHGASDGFRGNQYTDQVVSTKKLCLPNIDSKNKTANRIANEMGISHTSVVNAEKFVDGMNAADEVLPGFKHDIMSGKIKPTQADVIAVAKAPPEKRKEMAESLRTKSRKLTDEEKEKRRETREANKIIEAVDLTHEDSEDRPPLTGADRLHSLDADVERALENIDSYFYYHPDILIVEENRERVRAIFEKIKKYIKEIEEKMNGV